VLGFGFGIRFGSRFLEVRGFEVRFEVRFGGGWDESNKLEVRSEV
jgi:hypothetical protein